MLYALITGVKWTSRLRASKPESDPEADIRPLDLCGKIAYGRVASRGMTGNEASRIHNTCRGSGYGLAGAGARAASGQVVPDCAHPPVCPGQGGLMSYGSGPPEAYRRVANTVAEILRGPKPSEIPFHQASRFELVVNLKTAKALGLTVPPSILALADEVIE